MPPQWPATAPQRRWASGSPREFEPTSPFKPGFLCYTYGLGPVAQLVEQRTENPRVGSSILPQATIQEKTQP